MADEKPKRDRSKEIQARKRKRQEARNAVESIESQLRDLEERTRTNPTDADGDIDFAYRNMAFTDITPSMAPSASGWSWYLYSRTWPEKFLEICAKREDAKAKMAGTITNQRMEDDRRSQFAVLDRIGASLKRDVTSIVSELAAKFPDDVAEVLKKSGWKVETGSKENI